MMQNQADTTATRAVPLTLPSFPKFDLDEFTTVVPRWTIYKNSFVNSLVALNITNNTKKGTVTDPVLSKVIKIIKNERWYKLDTLPKGQETNELKQNRKIKDSLSLNDKQNIILKDNCIAIPLCFEIIVVKLAHIGHQGLVKTKSPLRSKVFF